MFWELVKSAVSLVLTKGLGINLIMQIVLYRDALIKPLQNVVGVVEKRQDVPVLGNILLSASGQELALTGTDLEIELMARIMLDAEATPGETTVPARKLLDICKTLPENAKITLSSEGDRLILRSGRSRYSLVTLPAAQFPHTDEANLSHHLTLYKAVLKSLFERVSFSMALQDVRYYLNGMLMEMGADYLRVVATDGHRLAVSQHSMIIPEALHQTRMIVPRKAIMELSRFLQDEDGSIDISLGSHHVRVKTQDMTFTTKLIEGRYPDYHRVLPKGGDKNITVDREDLRQALTRVSALFNEKYRGVRLLFSPQLLKIVATNLEQEEAEEHCETDYRGVAFEMGFNVRYLLEALSAIKSPMVQIICTAPNNSALIQEKDNQETQYVVMPMRL